MSVTLKVSGFERSLREIRKALSYYCGGNVYATVGVHKDAGMHKYGDLSVAEVAAKNHFGTERIPARPFLDVGVQRKSKEIVMAVSDDLSSGKTPREAIKVAGELAVRGVVEQIDATYSPPNSPKTIAKKGSSHPLIDTGQMRQSITYKIRKNIKDTE